MGKFQVEWSDEALLSSKLISDHIYQEWGIKPVRDFSSKIKQLITLIRDNVQLCPKSKIKNIRRCIITEHTSVCLQRIKRSYPTNFIY